MSQTPAAARRTSLRVAALLALSGTAAGAQTTVYSNVPDPLAPNYASVSYQAQYVAEMGDRVNLAPGTPRSLSKATVVMSTWSLASQYPTLAAANAAGWDHPFTFTLYDVGAGGAVGAVLWQQTLTQLVPWRPESDPTCPASSNPAGGWRAPNGSCYAGYAFAMDFDLGGVAVPDQFIYGLAFDAQTSGYAPIGASGPYNSLNFAVALNGAATVGSDASNDEIYFSYMQTPGSPGTTPFGPDYFGGGTYYSPMASFTATPEPATVALVGLGLAGLGVVARRRRRA